MEEPQKVRVFDEVIFTIIPSDELDQWQEEQIISNATSNGARYRPYQPDTILTELDTITHIISPHVDFPEYQEALNIHIPVVTSRWITDSIAKRRQTAPRQYSPDPNQFFRDVILTIGTLPESDTNAIIAGVHALGGQISLPLTKIVTHIVTTDNEHEKCILAKEKELPIKVVLPHWFDDCLRLGKKISERPYELPNAEILKVRPERPIEINDSPSLLGASISQPDTSRTTPPVSPSKSRKDLNAFNGRSVFLGHDLGLSEHLRDTLVGLIVGSGGHAANALDSADIYIGRYRETDDFVDAFVAEKILGNLSWLYHVLNRNRWSSPTSKLLHYPVPRDGLPGFSSLRISISNYTGDARTYVQSLVEECGAQFTKTMRQDNSHLITAHKSSEKYEAAQEWNISTVNHLWLEESYIKCAVQPLTVAKFTHFPPRTNLGETCGIASIDLERVKQQFVDPILRERQRFNIAAVASEARAEADEKARSEAIAREQAEASFMLKDTDTSFSSDVLDLKSTREQPGEPRASETIAPAQEKRSRSCLPIPDGKENEAPMSGRASKLKALGSLHKQAGDIALFQKEMKRKGGVLHGGRPQKDELVDDRLKSSTSKKRLSEDAADDDSEGEVQHQQASKRARSASIDGPSLPPIRFRMMVTGDDRWKGNEKREGRDKMKHRQLGILLTDDPKTVDILVAKSIIRTKKFVSAIARAPKVVGIEFLDAALNGKALPKDPPLLSDTRAEKQNDFRLAEALQRAKENRGQLLKGWGIYVSDHLAGGFDTYKDIVTANGGQVFAFRGSRRGTTIKRRVLNRSAGEESQNQGADDEYDYVYFVATDSTVDKDLWKQFRGLAEKQGIKARVVMADWLLLAALTQRVKWNAEWAWPES